MPTGYTADVQSGKVTEFRDYAMQCARAFGALVMMRDDPADAPIPDSFEPSDHYAKSIIESERRLRKLQSMSRADIEAAYEDYFAKQVAEKREWQSNHDAEKTRYEAMLAKVEAWPPPSAEHLQMKQFMREQLQESIKFDCYTVDMPTRTDPCEWHATEVASCLRRIADCHEEQAKEDKRASDRTEWVRALRESLKEPAK